MHLHHLVHRHHVLVQVVHDPQRARNDQNDDQDTEGQCEDVVGVVRCGGYVQEKDLLPGELLKIDTGCIVGFTGGVDYDIQFIGGIKNSLFGGEGLFFATLRGPGKVWIQSLPISRLAARILAFATYNRKEEGSILGTIGNILDGDRY